MDLEKAVQLSLQLPIYDAQPLRLKKDMLASFFSFLSLASVHSTRTRYIQQACVPSRSCTTPHALQRSIRHLELLEPGKRQE